MYKSPLKPHPLKNREEARIIVEIIRKTTIFLPKYSRTPFGQKLKAIRICPALSRTVKKIFKKLT